MNYDNEPWKKALEKLVEKIKAMSPAERKILEEKIRSGQFGEPEWRDFVPKDGSKRAMPVKQKDSQQEIDGFMLIFVVGLFVVFVVCKIIS